ncbi:MULTISPECIES: ISL3 family transposase [Streptomyces]|uniref:IS6 family transposase n=1 Tax=Streptomyces sviceus (strain ATCC 29083 / DSM 924 / JCM 4929 / NBRC 13980 / NCIMB 11184 / NRRL 5439 / UC 5370) TaxID=463191 RepID=D6XCV3_STRX2|nr:MULTISPECIES: ISL3 family transposase [Streptomyces]EFH29110.1 IS6 family transposase [Streptomyces sviceus ATCC 29083]
MPGLTRRYGRWTERLRSTIAAVGLALAGRAGARMAGVIGVSVSRSTVLRLVEALPEPDLPAPRVVGVDEYATRKGRHYGTVLVDVETRRPVDLLPDREESSLATWLAKRPGIEVVCRDRAPFFAERATVGAPQAVQVADRWHLWHNLSEAAERCVADQRGCLRGTALEPSQQVKEADELADPSGSPWPTGHRFADRTRANHVAVHALLAAGHSRRAIQRQLGMTYRPVKLLADATTPKDLFHGQRQGRPSVLDEYKPYLDDRWNQGCTNAWKAWEEIVPLGYKASYQRVRAYFRTKRLSADPGNAPPPSPRTVAGWILRHPDSLSKVDQLRLEAVLAHCPELEALTGHVRSFAQILTERQGQRLPDWLDAVRQDDLPGLHTLAAGIDRDGAAVTAGLTLPWSSGVVEGHVNCIKMLQRQMFGRAGFAPCGNECSSLHDGCQQVKCFRQRSTPPQEPRMSRTADIDLVFARAVTVDAVLRALASEGWSLQEPLGISYVVNHDGLFDWQSASTDQAAEVLTLVDSPTNVDHHVGVCIYQSTAETGGQLLFHAGRSHCSFIPTIDRRSLSGAPALTDMAWYLNALVPPLLALGLASYEARDLAD